MKNVQKFLCILLASVMICMSPMAEYVNINQIKTVEAADPITVSLLLEFILAACGVTVAATALDNVADSFENWLSSHGSDDAISNWNAAKTMSIISISAPLITSVLAWIGEKFSDLNSGSVESADFSSIYRVGSLSRNHSLVYDHCSAYREFGRYYLFCALPDESGYDYKGRMCIFSTASSSSRAFLVHTSVGWYIYTLNSRDELSKQSNMPSFNSVSYTYGVYPSSGEFYYSSGYFPRKDVRFDIFAETNLPVIYTTLTSVPADYFTFESLEPYVTATYNLDGIISDAFTSFGNYDSANLSNLAGLMLTPALIKTIMTGVNNAIDANKTDNGWSETVAQAIADAYAQGLADAKAQQGELEDEAKEEERASVVTGWLSKIYDAILTIPTAITQGVDILSDVFEVSVDIKDLITVIPTTIIEGFKEVFPTAETVVELIMGIPASMVDALTEVFPVADDLKEWITSVPASIVDAISTGVGVIADGLTAVKDAVLSIPLAIADAIAFVLEGLFVPDLTLVEAELDNISDALGWIGDLNSLINDFMLRLEAGDPPTVYLDFTKAEDSKYHGAGLCLAIDFSWYAKYKPTGDLIVGAFIWFMFFWYLFKRIPDIISGAGFITRDSDEVSIRKNKNNMKGGD